MPEACIFCNLTPGRIIRENELAIAIRDNYPVTDLHTLVIPKRHAPSYFDLTDEELLACHHLLRICREEIEARDEAVAGFNIGVNDREAAGQTIFHCHIHLIPRRAGDVARPRGGVRHLIPGKGEY